MAQSILKEALTQARFSRRFDAKPKLGSTKTFRVKLVLSGKILIRQVNDVGCCLHFVDF